MSTGGPETVHVDFRKYPDTVHWQLHMMRLGADEHGQWLWAPQGTAYSKGGEPMERFRDTAVKLVPATGWWTAIWNSGVGNHAFYIDIIAPPRWDAAPSDATRVTMIDLDLDVVGRRNGDVEIVDEDEFAEHQVTLRYPQFLIDGARTATARVFNQAVRHVEPFGEVAARWLRLAMALADES